MSEFATLARPYAEAAFKRAKELNETPLWSESLAFLAAVLQDPQLLPVIANPRVSKEQLTALLLDICGEHVHAEAANFLKVLIENGRLNLIASIFEQYEQFKADDEGYVNVDLFTAYALTKAEEKQYVAFLEKQLNKEVRATVSIDKSLIGGIVAKAGDKVIDGSISGRLNQLAKQL